MTRVPLRYARRNVLIGPDGEAAALYRADTVAYPFLPAAEKWALLRRLERNHDGFRSEKGRQNALKIYQAVTYLGWSIHNPPNLAASSG